LDFNYFATQRLGVKLFFSQSRKDAVWFSARLLLSYFVDRGFSDGIDNGIAYAVRKGKTD